MRSHLLNQLINLHEPILSSVDLYTNKDLELIFDEYKIFVSIDLTWYIEKLLI